MSSLTTKISSLIDVVVNLDPFASALSSVGQFLEQCETSENASHYDINQWIPERMNQRVPRGHESVGTQGQQLRIILNSSAIMDEDQ
jgi:hypothetical protein